jgi:hypothetical protein
MENIKFEAIKKASEARFNYKQLKNVLQLDSTSPPSVFIGSKLKYPNVNVGILSPLQRDENAWIYDAEKHWAEDNYGIRDVISLRGSLVNSRFMTQVQSARIHHKFLDIAKEIAQSGKPVDVEIGLKDRLKTERMKDQVVTPHGMRANINKARVTSNISIPRQIDKMANDEINAGEAMYNLYKNNFDEYTLNKILSVGVLGMKKNKKLVPTRWSITATDDTIGKSLLKEIRDFKWIEEYELFVGGFMGNWYLILLAPNVFSYELFELYLPGSSWNPSSELKASTDYENYYGRKNYASNTVGGYYAARLPILKYLYGRKRQASILAIRLETPSYWAALGVWVVRESVKKAMKTVPRKFADLNSGIEMMKKISKDKYQFDCEAIIKKSKLLAGLKSQNNLLRWI